jgi:hypothetical protein
LRRIDTEPQPPLKQGAAHLAGADQRQEAGKIA